MAKQRTRLIGALNLALGLLGVWLIWRFGWAEDVMRWNPPGWAHSVLRLDWLAPLRIGVLVLPHLWALVGLFQLSSGRRFLVALWLWNKASHRAQLCLAAGSLALVLLAVLALFLRLSA